MKTKKNRLSEYTRLFMASQTPGIVFISALTLMFFLFGCSQQEDASVNPTVLSKTSEGAGASSSGIGADVPEDSILCQVRGETLVVTHQDAYYQCCLEARILVHRSDFTLDVVEYDVGEPCDCMCTFDLTTTIIGLQSGTYTVQVWSESGQSYGTCLVTVPSGPFLTGVRQSDCQSYPERNRIAALGDSIVAAFQEDTLFVSHFNALYNCCFAIDVRFHQDGHILNFVEEPTGDPCYCMCYFDIVAAIGDMTPGTYLIRVWNEDQSLLFGETDIVIAPDAAVKTQPVSEEPPTPGGGWWYDTEQEGCKTYPKRNQSIKTNSYRMHRNVQQEDRTERRNEVSSIYNGQMDMLNPC